MALKTDYKDDVFSGNRKYQKIDNSDGTISLVDKTAYSQKGDTFPATDINEINKAINGLSAVATESANGLMSSEDKTALDNLKIHTHGLKGNSLMHKIPDQSDDEAWSTSIGENPKEGGYIVKAIRCDKRAPDWLLGGYTSGIVFGGEDTRGVISIDYNGDLRRVRVAGVSGSLVAWYADLLHSKNYTQYVKSTTKSFTLSASGWVSAGGWDKYVITDSLVTATSNQEVIPSPSINREQFKALQKANLVGTQENGIMYLWVYGAVPTIDIPITVIFRGAI